MSPDQQAAVDRFRASLRKSLAEECSCGECMSDEQINMLLSLTDRQLFDVFRTAQEVS